ncbi:hypothetical protein DB35_19335 [Streptomyces abyssalis]|uniref:Glutathione S-transferase n=1 Tax=Streptomyces abyssalis TaxID=933944 RepID=A0A1E7JLC8_9ACTN|nr:DUF952 domain-containing protein [Streptomyces abyssalis]OEU88450.1 hypothetical protein AN215_20480 [Streptomyces abyssalis]OEU89188.1 hypothetical protein DB35_19335 [Streptomyces abyssalis]
MAELLHITERSVWEAARASASGTYEMSTRGLTLEEVGFIHCSQRHQLPQVARMLYGGQDPAELVVLVIESERISAPVRYEPPEPAAACAGDANDADGADGADRAGGSERPEDAAAGGAQLFPHVYGPLPVSAVVAEEPWTWNSPEV